jgi:5-methylcytosine-specific restriction endonuclease McrA
MNPFSFQPTTPGEYLLHFLTENILKEDGISIPEEFSWSNATGGRGQALRDYVVSVSSLNLTARFIKKAERVLDIDDSTLHHGEFTRYLQQTLGLVRHPSDVIDEIARQALYAAKMSKRSISKATKRKVRDSAIEVGCYLCGNMCIHKSEDPKSAIYYEHIWPASYGGDSIEQNLLPACYGCNEAKKDMLLWQTGAIFSFVLKPSPSERERTSIARREKIARRIQDILFRANLDRSSLKDAARKIGPARFENLVAIDTEDAIDYFNLHFN